MINNIKSKFSNHAQHYELFLLAMQIFYVCSLFFVIKLAAEVVKEAPSFESYFNISFIGFTLSSLLIIGIQFAATVFANKFMAQNNILGFIIIAVLALFSLPSITFPVGCFGFWAIFNRKFRETYFIDQRPTWLTECYEQIEKWTSPQKA